MADNDTRDILENLTQNLAGNDKTLDDVIRRLSSIDRSLQQIAKNGGFNSQANQKTFGSDRPFRDSYDTKYGSKKFSRRDRKGFMDSFEDQLLEGFLGSDFKKDVAGVFNQFAKRFNTDIEGLQDELGKQLGNAVLGAFRKTTLGKDLTARLDEAKKNFLYNLSNKGNRAITSLQTGQVQQNLQQRMDRHLGPLSETPGGVRSFVQGGIQGIKGGFNLLKSGIGAIKGAPGAISEMLKPPPVTGPQDMPGHVIGPGAGEAAGEAASTAAEGLGKLTQTVAGATEGVAGLGGSTGQLIGSFAKLGPQGLAVAGAMVALEVITDKIGKSFKEIGEGFSKIFGALSAASKRDQVTREKNLAAQKERMKADYETMVRYPFELLKNAATDLTNAWNQSITTITATQGYTKSDVQDLMAAYAERIRNEGLSSYVSGSDLVNNLANILKAGMSGAVAEEFAYQATVLNKAVPTQDFFSYASTYSSIAANAMRDGKSQTQAIEEANESLKSFASSLLYTSRELTGGFSTGLTNASSLYEDAAKIARAANSENIDAISSTLVAVQGYIGAVAPDLASGIIGVINKLATGGNSSDAVALRSLAGVNASNTEFLKALAEDPQSILGAMFDNLATMFEDSSDAYMEKAEGYASLFGLDAASFQRVDFNELADAIRSMNVNNTALNENMSLLLAGETTTTTEQLKQQQINKYMIEEGLAYVIDNEAAQLIQQHMWEEQMQRELVQSTFAVDLAGDSKEGFMKIVNGIQNIINFLNPLGWLKKLGNITTTIDDIGSQQADIQQMLELGKVGQGNQTDLMKLVTSNQDLGLSTPLVNLMGGRSRYNNSAGFKQWYGMSNPLFKGISSDSLLSLQSELEHANTAANAKMPMSRYHWGMVSKTQGNAASSLMQSALDSVVNFMNDANETTGSTDVSAATAKAAIDKMMEDSYIKDQFVKENKTYEEWASSASKFGIADFDAALEAAGYQKSDVEQYFADQEAKAGQEEKHIRDLKEEHFWEVGVNFWEKSFWEDYRDPFFEHLDSIEDLLETIQQNQVDWKDHFDEEWLEGRWDSGWITDRWDDGWLDGAWTTWTTGWGNWIEKNWLPVFGATDSLFFKLYTSIASQAAYKSYYGNSKLLKELNEVKQDAEKEGRKSVADQIGQVLSDTLIGDGQTDPALQTNILLGQILVYVGKIMQQTENSGGGTAMIDQLAAMSLGMTKQTP